MAAGQNPSTRGCPAPVASVLVALLSSGVEVTPSAHGRLRGSDVDLADFCASLQVSTQSLASTASGADAASMIRIPDPGMEAFYRRLIGALLARTETAQPFPHLPTIIRAMIWDFLARTAGSADITLWFGCDSPIAASAPLLSVSGTPSLKDSSACVVFGGYHDFMREVQIWPIPFDSVDRFARQGDTWRRLRDSGRALLLSRMHGGAALGSGGAILWASRGCIRPSRPPPDRHVLVG